MPVERIFERPFDVEQIVEVPVPKIIRKSRSVIKRQEVNVEYQVERIEEKQVIIDVEKVVN